MRSRNPVLSRQGAFSRGGYAGFAQRGAPQAPGPHPPQQNPYAQTGPRGPGQPPNMTQEQLQQAYGAPPAGPMTTGRMTFDDVVARTAMTLGTLVVLAGVAWFVLPDNFVVAGVAALAAFVVAMVLNFKRKVSPGLTLAYAGLEGLFLGVISHAMETYYPGIVVQAVLGTMAVFAGMLIAYKTGVVRVTNRFYKVGMAVAIAFLILMAVNLVAMMAGGGDGLGLRSGWLGIGMGVLGIALGAFFLALDFHAIEAAVQQGAPQEESWRAAFGLTLSLVWIYLELIRLLGILRN